MNTQIGQVGGDHYQSEYQHWDLVACTGMGYFEGQATKYVARWRKKSGLQDLSKALSYVNKLMLISKYPEEPKEQFVANYEKQILAEVTKFARINHLNVLEHKFFEIMTTWCTRADLAKAVYLLTQLADTASAKPVPLEDSNKHSERANDL